MMSAGCLEEACELSFAKATCHLSLLCDDLPMSKYFACDGHTVKSSLQKRLDEVWLVYL